MTVCVASARPGLDRATAVAGSPAYRLLLTTPGGTVALAPGSYQEVVADAECRVRLAWAGRSVADNIRVLAAADGGWQPFVCCWDRADPAVHLAFRSLRVLEIAAVTP